MRAIASFIAVAFGAAGFVIAQTTTLPPADFLLPESALPAYEQDIDHAGMIRALNKAAAQRGERIYEFVCHSCHGDENLRGALPDARSFAHDAFQRGSDPYAMYQTITRGWRRMAPQVQLVPQEKYDVIHFIRENLLAKSNPTQRFAVTPEYLASLPTGRSRGPAPAKREPWKEMDYGNFLMGTFEVADAANRAAAAARVRESAENGDVVPAGANIAYKGIALRLDPGPGGVSAGKAWVVFEHDTMRLAGAWTGEGFIDWAGINFDSRHIVRPRTVGDLIVETADGPGWANPATGDFADQRIVGADGRRFGPLPRSWMQFRGVYRHGRDTVISYTVGDAPVLEAYAFALIADAPVFTRTLNIGKSSRDLILRVANAGTVVAVGGNVSHTLSRDTNFVTLRIAASATPARLTLRLAKQGATRFESLSADAAPPRDLSPLTRSAPAQWAETLTTPVVESDASGAFAWARLTLPFANPWRSRLRTSGVDFLPGGKSAVVCCWDGDVWRVDGIDGGAALTWRRIASGLFQPLGIKVRPPSPGFGGTSPPSQGSGETGGGEIFVTCRDQLVRLRDLNGDGETDFYECINSDHQVTEHFHEFAMGLQTDTAGNFYYAKSARHNRTALVPQHGTLLKISADGATTEILANGFRAANGVCLNPDGSVFVTDQEGHWTPMNRINRVVPGQFYGNMWSYGAPEDASDGAMQQPFCWVDKAYDRSPGELVRVEGKTWGALEGALLNLSYGRGRLEIVVFEGSGDAMQGAICALPMPDFPTGIMRGRCNPADGQLYVCGLSAWATSVTQQEGGFYRLRSTGRPACLPIAWHVVPDGVELTFSEPPERATATDASRYDVRVWSLQRSAKYGSPHVGEHVLAVTRAELIDDGHALRLTIPDLQPTQGISINCRLRDAAGREVERLLNGTIHRVPKG